MSNEKNKVNETEKSERLKKEHSRKLRKRILIGCGCIIAIFAMLLGILYGTTEAEEKIRMIVLIVFCSCFGASIVGFILYVFIGDYLQTKRSDPDYVAQQQAKRIAKKAKKEKNK